MTSIKVKLISGRTIAQGSNVENKTSDEYFNAVARCELNSRMLEKLGVKDGDDVKVKTEFGEVVVKARKCDGNPDYIAFIPMGPWANKVTNPYTGGVGMPGFKGVEAEIMPTKEKTLNLKELMATYRGK
ncbi:MAG: molybdopterin dinucleotide binding domain-containing protein [Methanocellales archaeon]